MMVMPGVSQEAWDQRTRDMVCRYLKAYEGPGGDDLAAGLARFLTWRGYEARVEPGFQPGVPYRLAIGPGVNGMRIVQVAPRTD